MRLPRLRSLASLVLPAVPLPFAVSGLRHDVSFLLALVLGGFLVASVIASVVHAEAIAHRLGEPLGTLVLAFAITVVEVALIVALVASGGPGASTLARDTVFAAVMIVCNGVLGGAFLVNAARTHLVEFSEQGANALLATLMTLASLALVLPAFSSDPSSQAHLFFAAVASASVYAVFLFAQNGRHRWMFLAPDALADEADDTQAHVLPHASTSRFDSLALRAVALLVSLASVVLLAKVLSSPVKSALVSLGAPVSFVGVVIALLVLLPESVTAFRAASRNEMQTSINLALGSALASIGLTIPALAVASLWLATPTVLALGAVEIGLLATTAFVSALSFGSGKATVLQASVHLALFASFLFLALTR